MKLLPTKTSPLEDDDLVEEEAIEVNKTKSLGNDLEDKSLENNEIINIKELKSHPLDNVIGNLNQRTLRSQAQDKSIFIVFFHHRTANSNDALQDDNGGRRYANVYSLSMDKLYLTKDEEGESVDNTKYRGMIGSLLYLTTSRLDIMFSVCLCARFQEDPKTSHLEAVKRIFRYVKGTTHLELWYLKGSGIETIVYAESDQCGRLCGVRKSTSGICTFMGCCLTSWFLKKQTALAIFTTEAEYVSARKACQQALWMKQALVDYGIRLDVLPFM
ncbi:hypothetical protein Tco_0332626 [Tanacetum coccineum]